MPHPIRRLRRLLNRRRRPIVAGPVQASLSRIGTLALEPPPARTPAPATWATRAGYLDLAKQALKCLGAPAGGRNRIAATMTRVLWQARDPAVELQRLQDEAQTALRLLHVLRREQARQAGQADAEEAFRAVIAQRNGRG